MKKIIAMILVIALTAAISVGATLAYLTDTDEDVNVMTMGNVSIAQHEYQRATSEDGSYKTDTIDEQTSYVLEAFEQGKPLLPFVGNYASGGWDATPVRMTQVGSYGGMNVLIGENAVDKFVTVENTGKTDAYVRTLVAIEYGTGNPDLIGRSYHFTWQENMVGEIKIDGNNYYLYEFVYLGGAQQGGVHDNGILPAGDTSYPSLAQVYLKSEATNEDCAALDGNGNGTLDILVLSQAVQADGFANATTALDTAFGDITTDNHPWAGEGNAPVIPVLVSDADAFATALENGEDVVLMKDIDLSKIDLTTVEEDVTINANGHKITTTDAYGVEVAPGKNITISNADVEMTKEGDYITYAAGLKIANGDYAGATITLQNCSISMANGDWSYAVNMPAGVKNLNLVIDNCVLEGAVAVQCWGDNNTITITNSDLVCTYTTNATFTSYCVSLQNDGTNVSENNTLVIDNCKFSYNGVDNFNKTIYSVEDFGTDNNVTVTNCTYGDKVAVYGN